MPRIDFVQLRREVKIQQVLGLMQCEPVVCSSQNWRGPCPLHGSQSPTSRIFSVDLRRNLFRCFKCQAGGNQLDLWAQATGLPIYAASVELCGKLGIELPLLESVGRNP